HDHAARPPRNVGPEGRVAAGVQVGSGEGSAGEVAAGRRSLADTHGPGLPEDGAIQERFGRAAARDACEISDASYAVADRRAFEPVERSARRARISGVSEARDQ